MIATYAWNCSRIDGTDVVRSVPAMGREFKFPFNLAFDVNDPALVGPSPDPSISVLEYIKHTAQQVDFARHVVALVVEDLRQAHRNLPAGDVQKARMLGLQFAKTRLKILGKYKIAGCRQ